MSAPSKTSAPVPPQPTEQKLVKMVRKPKPVAPPEVVAAKPAAVKPSAPPASKAPASKAPVAKPVTAPAAPAAAPKRAAPPDLSPPRDLLEPMVRAFAADVVALEKGRLLSQARARLGS
jgi:hypothetical protein